MQKYSEVIQNQQSTSLDIAIDDICKGNYLCSYNLNKLISLSGVSLVVKRTQLFIFLQSLDSFGYAKMDEALLLKLPEMLSEVSGIEQSKFTEFFNNWIELNSTTRSLLELIKADAENDAEAMPSNGVDSILAMFVENICSKDMFSICPID